MEDVVRGSDGLIREASVKYFNSTEDTPRYTTRSVRTLVRLFNVEDGHWKDDMMEVEKLLVAKNMKVVMLKSEVGGEVIHDRKKSSVGDEDPSLCKCCCQSHCSLSLHVSRGVNLVKQEMFEKPQVDVDMEVSQPEKDYKVDILDDYLTEEVTMCAPGEVFAQDTFMGLITSLNMNFV